MKSALRRMLVGLCGGALLVAMLVDALAMLGRQLQLPLIGSIEIVQAAVLIAGSGALLIATIERAHARVSIVLNRLPPRVRGFVERGHDFLGAVFFSLLLVGTVWLIADLWGGHEESELLRIPYKPLRLLAAAALSGLVIVLTARLFGRSER